MVKFGLRWYLPTLGTWTQEDTLDSALDPSNANRYAYTGDDPIDDSETQGSIATISGEISACRVGSIAGVVLGAIVTPEEGASIIGAGVDAIIGCAVAVVDYQSEENGESFEGNLASDLDKTRFFLSILNNL